MLTHSAQVYQDGVVGPVGGTSASAPTFAGLVSLLNGKHPQLAMRLAIHGMKWH